MLIEFWRERDDRSCCIEEDAGAIGIEMISG
jgi:hypothetical protein